MNNRILTYSDIQDLNFSPILAQKLEGILHQNKGTNETGYRKQWHKGIPQDDGEEKSLNEHQGIEDNLSRSRRDFLRSFIILQLWIF